MFKKLTKHLLIVNICVFLLVLGIFSVAVYLSVSHNLDTEEKHRLQLLTDTMINSIEPEDEDEDDPKHAVPDVILSYDKQEGIYSGRVTLQWFDPAFEFRQEKGTLKIDAPFNKDAGMQTQDSPHAILLTKPVERLGHILGYMRVGVSLAETDNFKHKLLTGLVSGTVLALLVSALAILWLVKQSLKPLEISIQKLSQFGADASHELKNPLMAIKTNATVALKYSQDIREKDREKFELILNAADQMVATTAGLLRLAKADQPLNAAEAVQFNVNESLAEIVREFESIIAARKLVIDVNEASEIVEMTGKKEEIKIALKNIFENAIQYSKDGGTIVVRSAREGAKIKVEIADSGIGISDAELPKIFDRFWRSDKARNHASGGSGLGLSIVDSIVKRSRGNVVVRSKLGEGSTFLVSFPVA